MADTKTTQIIYRGHTFPITRGEEADIGDRVGSGKQTAGVIKADGKWKKVPTFKIDLLTKVGRNQTPVIKNYKDIPTDKMYGMALEDIHNKQTELRGWERVAETYKDRAGEKIIDPKAMTKFKQLIEGLEAEIDLKEGREKGATTKTIRTPAVPTGKFEIAEANFKTQPAIEKWLKKMIRKDKAPKTELEKAPRNLWKFLMMSHIGGHEELQNMSEEELIGEDEVSGKLEPYPSEYRVNAILKNITNNNYGLFEQDVNPKSNIKDLPLDVFYDKEDHKTKIKWSNPEKTVSVKFTPKDETESITWTPDELIYNVNEELEGSMGQTAWYPVAKAIRSFVKAKFGRLPSASPLAQTTVEWAGNYADVKLEGDLESGQLHDFAQCLKEKNDDAYFFFLLAIEMGFRKGEAFTLNAMPPAKRKKADRRKIKGLSGVRKIPAFPNMYEIQIITWKTHWIGVYSHKEICANPDVNKLITKRLDQIARGEGIEKTSEAHALVGEDNKYYPVRFLETKKPKQTAKQVENMKTLYNDIKECFTKVGATDEYFQDHAFHAFRHIFAQFQLSMSNWDYASVADMGHWNTLNVLKDSYGEKDDNTRYMEKIERMKLGMKNPIKLTAEQIKNKATPEQREYFGERGLEDELSEFQNMPYVKTHDKRFIELIENGTIDLATMPKPQQTFYAELREGEIGNVLTKDKPELEELDEEIENLE